MHLGLITAAIDFSSMYVWFCCFRPFDVTPQTTVSFKFRPINVLM